MTQFETNYRGFEEVKSRRERIANLIDRHRQLIEELGLPAVSDNWLQKLRNMEERVNSDSFKVLVLGQFNRGKSTFINALLGAQVLPTYATPTTAVINEVKFGVQPSALLYPRPTAPGEVTQPIPIAIQELEGYVVVDEKNAEKPNPYVCAQVFWPLDLCKSGLELIDSPGLNEDPIREQVTVSYLSKADAVVMVLDAQQPLTENEQTFFEEFVRPLGHDDAFWVFNKINQVDVEERDRVEAWCRRKLDPLVRYDERIFFVDARGAMRAKVDRDQLALTESNLAAVERSLEHFLTFHRGRNKVLVPARELQVSVNEVLDVVRGERELLAVNLQELIEKFHRNEPPLKRLEDRAASLSRRMKREVGDLTQEIGSQAQAFAESLAARMPELVERAKPTTKMTINPFRIRTVSGEIANEFLEQLAAVLQREMTVWRTGPIAELMTKRLREIQEDLREDLRGFEEELRAVRLDMSLVSAGSGAWGGVAVGLGTLEESLGEDLAKRGFGTAALAGAVSLAGVGLAIAGVALLPIVLGPVFIAIAATGASSGSLVALIKSQVAKDAADEMRRQAGRFRDDVVAAANSQLKQLQDDFGKSLTTQVGTVRGQLKRAIRDKERGEGQVVKRRKQLDGLVSQVESIMRELDEIIDRTLEVDRERLLASGSGVGNVG